MPRLGDISCSTMAVLFILALVAVASAAHADGTRITIWSGPDASGWSISSGPDCGCRPMYRPNYRPQPMGWDSRRYVPYPQPQRWGSLGDYVDDRPRVGYDSRAIEAENKRLRDALNERNRLERALSENARLRRALEAGCQRY